MMDQIKQYARNIIPIEELFDYCLNLSRSMAFKQEILDEVQRPPIVLLTEKELKEWNWPTTKDGRFIKVPL